MIVIMGASGNTGNIAARGLLKAGKKVRVLGRSAEHLKELADLGAEVVTGDVENPDFVDRAFAGADGVYLILPPKHDAADFRAYQNLIADNAIAAIRKRGIRKVVLLSSFGTHVPQDTGVLLGLHDTEQKLNALADVDAVYLRAGFFLENIYGMMDTVKAVGVLGGFPIRADVAIPMVATRDIGAAAARAFIDGFTGKTVRYVAGARDLSFNDVVALIGPAIGRPDLTYVQFPYDGAYDAMTQQLGMSPSLAKAYVDFCRAVNENAELWTDYRRTPENTTPTGIESYLDGYAARYRG